MTIENAIKTLGKHGTVEHNTRGHWSVHIGSDIVGFYASSIGPDEVGRHIDAVYVKSADYNLDQTFFPSLASAIRCASRTVAS